MSNKKDKKQFKPVSTIAPKILLNRKWTVWRKSETKIRDENVKQELRYLILNTIEKSFKNSSRGANINGPLNDKISVAMFNTNNISKSKNYCYYVGRARSVNRRMFMARHMFRKFARYGMLPGFIKERC